jgi:hypothetical protein
MKRDLKKANFDGRTREMKWIMYFALLGALIISLAAGVISGNWVTLGSKSAPTVVPAVKGMPADSVCPGQTRVCPASGKRASAHLQA